MKMAGWWAEADTGFCYREQGITCAEGTCGHCDGVKTMWTVRFAGRITPVTVRAATFMGAVAKTVEYAKAHDIAEHAIVSIEYLAY
jgi:hypothetical protein